ncbi:putative trans-sialidase, Group V [Trypanosoma cruzi]|uniref:Putative trans-sialidase, Group V n=1 Tax=Trypanosoma cruzi TaxID=5693 RepID=A0A2V2WJJ5_TRYCR|nr:putative trans-sialidase, Group V [Trypanosoma cruzi]
MFCCGTSGAAAAGEASSPECSKGKHYVWRGKKDEETVSLLRVPSLLKVGSDVFAAAEAHCKDGTNKDFTGIASELLKWTDEQASKELDTTELKTQVLEECPSEQGECSCRIADQAGTKSGTRIHVSKPTTVVQGSDIYMLVGNYSFEGASDDQAGGWGLMLVKGNVSNKEGENNGIYWNDTYVIPWSYKVKQHESLMRLIGSGGSDVKMEDGTLVFPLEGTRKKRNQGDGNEKDGKTVSLILHSKDAKTWKLPKGMSADGCGVPSVVNWEKDKLMMMTACDGRRRVYESGDKGDSWTEALGTLSRVWGNKKGEKVELVGSGFTTAKIGDDRDVMLITLPVYSSKDGNGKGVLHLWLTDNTHIVDIGPVSGEEEDVAASSLLYKSGGGANKKDELIALYEKESGDEDASLGMASVRLTARLEKVKEVLKTWKEVDERVSQLCSTLLAGKDRLSETACSTDKITDGLVGFLSGNFSDKTWSDEYLGVNAKVKGNDGATKASDGVKFRGAWAEWPVGSQGENQLYHFANYNFTLVATVSIDGVPKEGSPIPLLGAKMNGDENPLMLGLSYDKEKKKWRFLCGGKTTTEHSSDWDPETTKKDHVVILRRNGSQGSAYVEGQRVGGNAPCGLENTDSKEISHFYIGGDGDKTRKQEDVPVTVTNVLLYNCPLSSEEITALTPNKAPTPSLEEKPSDPSTVSSGSVVPPTPLVTPNAQQTETPSTPAGTQLTEQGQSMGSSKGAGSGGASTTAVSTVSTPSAEEESVVQVTSGTSLDGTQTVDSGSTADGEPTMQTRGGTNGQEEEGIQPRIREVNATALNSSLGNVSQGNNSDAGTVRERRLLPSLLLLGLWGFAAL